MNYEKAKQCTAAAAGVGGEGGGEARGTGVSAAVKSGEKAASGRAKEEREMK